MRVGGGGTVSLSPGEEALWAETGVRWFLTQRPEGPVSSWNRKRVPVDHGLGCVYDGDGHTLPLAVVA